MSLGPTLFNVTIIDRISVTLFTSFLLSSAFILEVGTVILRSSVLSSADYLNLRADFLNLGALITEPRSVVEYNLARSKYSLLYACFPMYL